MKILAAILYIIAVVLLVAASFGVGARVHLALMAAACALLAFALPFLQAAFS